MNYGLIGETGRLGSEVKKLFEESGEKLVYSYSLDGENNNGDPEIIVDCSLPEVFSTTIKYVKDFNVPLVIATTGLNSGQLSELFKLSKYVPIVQSFNYSIGVQILLKLTDDVHKIIPDWDIEISETHHRFKKDKPSGTAKMIADVLGDNNVNISSLRLGNVAGEHTVSFGGLGETISLTHAAISRRTFAEGIYKSANFVLKSKPGLYSFTDVIFGNSKVK